MPSDLTAKKVKKTNIRRIVALIGVIAIVVMVFATLLTAIIDESGMYFRGCLIVTIALPIALWVFLWSYGAMLHKHTTASFDIGGSENED